MSPFVPLTFDGMAGESLLHLEEFDYLMLQVPHRGGLLEIGSHDGVTAGMLARRWPESRIVSIDPYHWSPESVLNWRKNAVGNQCLWVGTVQQFHEFCRDPFDIVFLDGDHSFVSVYSDLIHVDHLCRLSIIAHDFAPYYPQVVNAVERFCEVAGWVIEDTVRSLAILRRR